MKKRDGVAKQTSLLCKNFGEVFNATQSVSKQLRNRDISCKKTKNKNLSVLDSAAFLRNNWFFGRRWLSAGKEVFPYSKMRSDESIISFLHGKRKHITIQEESNNRKGSAKVNSPINDEELIQSQQQNNALSSGSSSPELFPQISTSASSIQSFETSRNKNEIQVFESKDYSQVATKSHKDIIDVAEEILIPIKNKKTWIAGNLKEHAYCEEIKKLTIQEALGEDFVFDSLKRSKSLNVIHPLVLTTRTRNTEELRIRLLKDLYKKIDYVTHIQETFKKLAELLLEQFQDFNISKRNERMSDKRKDLSKHVTEMKQRNDEIFLRICKASENNLLKLKDTMSKNDFFEKWDKMLIDLSIKDKQDNHRLQEKINELASGEELAIKEHERKMINLEHSSIKSAFVQIKNEILKVNEKRQEIDHFIIRLEMRRENINKINHEIESIAPCSFIYDQTYFPEVIIQMKNEIIIIWKNNMGELSKDFKFDEKLFNDLVKSFQNDEMCLDDELPDGKSTENANINANFHGQTKQESTFTSEITKNNDNFPSIQSCASKNSIIKSSSEIEKKRYFERLEMQMLKHNQKLSNNFTFSYFVPWRKDSYERTLSNFSYPLDEDDEEEEKEVVQYQGLNYKRILAVNPLIKKSKMSSNNKKVPKTKSLSRIC